MSQGNPLDARHPIRGLTTGDSFAWTIVSGEVLDQGNLPELLRRVQRAAPGVCDVLVVAFPARRHHAVRESMKRGTT